MKTESELVRRCCQGDRAAQRELYDQTSERIYSLLLRMTGNPDDAFDLAQETYIRAFEKIGQFQGRSSVATWIYRIAVTQALQLRRNNQRTRARLNQIPLPESVEADDDRIARRLDLEVALSTIDPSDRVILLLRYQGELDYRAISEVMGCPEGTVASRLSRARSRIRETLENPPSPAEETASPERPTEAGGLAAEPSRGGQDSLRKRSR